MSVSLCIFVGLVAYISFSLGHLLGVSKGRDDLSYEYTTGKSRDSERK